MAKIMVFINDNKKLQVYTLQQTRYYDSGGGSGRYGVIFDFSW
jgi:hypothetical protein